MSDVSPRRNPPRLVAAGNTIFVQACARMMSAAWIKKQISDSSTAPDLGISGIAYAMRFTVASDIGMAFELGVKSVAQGLSPNPDGQRQVLKSHELFSILWAGIKCDVRQQIDREAEAAVCRRYGNEHAGKVLLFKEYLEKHAEFLDRTVDNRYALPAETQWKSDHRIIADRWFEIANDSHDGKQCVDGIGVLLAYWWAIMETAWQLRWEEKRCEKDAGLAADRDEAPDLVNRAIAQMLGNLPT